MHPAAHDYVARRASHEPLDVLDIGGRDVNGTCRDLFPNARYMVLDTRHGEGVDIVADARDWTPARRYDLVVCTEVLEHVEHWHRILGSAHKATRRGGWLIVTAAGPGRPPHSAIDEQPIRPDEWYENIEPDRLRQALEHAGWHQIEVDVDGLDVRATARKR